MLRIRVQTSSYDTSGEAVAVEYGEVVWAGPIAHLKEAGRFDTLFCHDDDEEGLLALLRGWTFEAVD